VHLEQIVPAALGFVDIIPPSVVAT
jgi:hypothetical protein